MEKNENQKKETVDRDLFYIGKIEAPTININNLIIDGHQKIDKFIINKTGVYLIFEYSKTKGILKGNINDEFLFIKKEKILNPLNEKNSYIKKINERFNINEDWVKIIIKYPKIKRIDIESNQLIKKDEDLVFGDQEIINEDALYDFSDRFNR